MAFLRRLLLGVTLAKCITVWNWQEVIAFSPQTFSSCRYSSTISTVASQITHGPTKSCMFAVPPPGGLSFEEEQTSVTTTSSEASQETTPSSSSSSSSSSSGQIHFESNVSNNIIATTNSNENESVPRQIRGKVNEIDFCMSPSDVSLSRLYQTSPMSQSMSGSSIRGTEVAAVVGSKVLPKDAGTPRIMSLTRALNSASNRAVRRILLSRSWPSPEALNISLRQVLSSGNNPIQDNRVGGTGNASKGKVVEGELSDVKLKEADENTAKCPVPRPILNIIMKEQGLKVEKRGETVDDTVEKDTGFKLQQEVSSSPLGKKGRTDEKWVEEQLQAFRETYGSVEGYQYAEAYMECILSLATSGVESDRVSEVMEQGIYEDAYKRVLSVLGNAGVTFEEAEGDKSRMKIAAKLRDDDICLSMLDKINIKNGGKSYISISMKNETVVVDKPQQEEDDDEELEEAIDQSSLKIQHSSDKDDVNAKAIEREDGTIGEKTKEKKVGNFVDMILSRMIKKKDDGNQEKDEVLSLPSTIDEEKNNVKVSNESEQIKPEDLGGVLLSKEEPTITRQLNVLSNVVKRTLLFGGDQEILVLSKTLEADRPAFIQRWYPETVKSIPDDDLVNETRPGVQFFNNLVQLLKDCYSKGVVTTLDPPLPLSSSYANSYERLTAMLAELGSGYVRPMNGSKILSKKPQTAREELIRFSQWEVSLRKTKPDVSNFPSDLVGSWQVKDEIGGKVIGTSTIVFKPEGKIEVAPPLKGIKWRLDPGPTHLDTCTFQVLSEDGAILQYRGFMDRGARLESRFSKRSIKIRGTVSFQMRDSNAALIGEDYKRDLLPIENQPGTTRFVMSKVFDLNG
jgi:hypothetical protein